MYVKVKATPNARKEVIERKGEDTFLISVKEPAKQNRANKRIVELIAAYFKISVGKVRIVNGHHSPTKLLSVDARACLKTPFRTEEI